MRAPRPLVLLPGFNGAPRQPILEAVAAAAGAGFEARFPGLPCGRASPGFERELAHLEAHAAGPAPSLVGRSFGGRVALRYAGLHRVRALVLLAFPVRPPGKPRPEDEAALLAVEAPTLIVQGDADPLGPVSVLAPLCARNPAVRLELLEAAGHGFTARQQRRAVELAAAFLRRPGR